MVADIATEVEHTTACSGPSSNVGEQLGCLKAFLSNANLQSACTAACPEDREQLLHLLGVLKSVAKGVTVWYAPFGRRRAAAKQLSKAIEYCLFTWTDPYPPVQRERDHLVVDTAAKTVRKLMDQRRRTWMPLVAGAGSGFGARDGHDSAAELAARRHSFRMAMFDYCRRPDPAAAAQARAAVAAVTMPQQQQQRQQPPPEPRVTGFPQVARDTEAAVRLASHPLTEAEWAQRLDAEARRDDQARMYFMSAVQERAHLLQGLAAGMDTRFLEPPSYEEARFSGFPTFDDKKW